MLSMKTFLKKKMEQAHTYPHRSSRARTSYMRPDRRVLTPIVGAGKDGSASEASKISFLQLFSLFFLRTGPGGIRVWASTGETNSDSRFLVLFLLGTGIFEASLCGDAAISFSSTSSMASGECQSVPQPGQTLGTRCSKGKNFFFLVIWVFVILEWH